MVVVVVVVHVCVCVFKSKLVAAGLPPKKPHTHTLYNPPLQRGVTHPWRVEEDHVLPQLREQLEEVPLVRAHPPRQPHRLHVVPQEAAPVIYTYICICVW